MKTTLLLLAAMIMCGCSKPAPSTIGEFRYDTVGNPLPSAAPADVFDTKHQYVKASGWICYLNPFGIALCYNSEADRANHGRVSEYRLLSGECFAGVCCVNEDCRANRKKAYKDLRDGLYFSDAQKELQ